MGFNGQFKQDEFIDRCVFQRRVGGVFFDIGAHDGITYSNTYFLEKERGWTGICVEALPDRFCQLAGNRTAICICGCVFPKPGTKKFLKVSGPDMLSGVNDVISKAHLRQIATDGGTSELIDVEAYTFNNILKQNRLSQVDYCSLDTEGCEWEILKSVDFTMFRPTCWTIEDNCGKLKLWFFMFRHGYTLVEKLGRDFVFVDRGYAKTMPRVGFLKPWCLALRTAKWVLNRIAKFYRVSVNCL